VRGGGGGKRGGKKDGGGDFFTINSLALERDGLLGLYTPKK